MEQYSVKKRYYIRFTSNGVSWSSLCGKSGAVYYFTSLESARAYVPTVWEHIADIVGVRIQWETYYVDKSLEEK